jgi:hypothetical protein
VPPRTPFVQASRRREPATHHFFPYVRRLVWGG